MTQHEEDEDQQKRIANLERLVSEARVLMILVGESDDVPIQFRQHAWLKEANLAVPPK